MASNGGCKVGNGLIKSEPCFEKWSEIFGGRCFDDGTAHEECTSAFTLDLGDRFFHSLGKGCDRIVDLLSVLIRHSRASGHVGNDKLLDADHLADIEQGKSLCGSFHHREVVN